MVLPEEMSAERFEKIRGYGADVIATPGSESNVKEIYDKVRELRADPANRILNQFEEPGNYRFHFHCTAHAAQEVIDSLGLDVAAFVSAMGSAGTIAAGEGLRPRNPDVRIVAVEPMQCPTLHDVGFGAHRIEGIGDKHVTWIHNVWATDLLVCVDDLECLEGLQLLQEGSAALEAAGVEPALARSFVGFFGISGVCNVLAAIRAADHYALGPRQAVVTIATDGFDRYPSVLRRLDAEQGTMDVEKARRRIEIFRSRRTGWLLEATPEAAPALAQPEVLHLGGAAGQDRGGAARPGGPGLVGRAAGARARDRPPDPGAPRVSFPGCVSGLRCVKCGARYARGLDGPCAACGPEGVLEIEFDLARARRTLTPRALRSRPLNVWRYAELLPVPAGARRPALEPGWTPILDTPRLAEWAGVRKLLVKDEGRNPTASFKDRASVVGVARALSRRAKVVACASTGNAATSLAGAAASVGLPCVIFVPESAPEPKLAQLLIFGARVVRVRGSYDATWEMCQRACDRHGWYNRNAAVNPSLVEGKKTAGLEIAEQCGAEVPDWVAVSVGDGCTIAGIGKGLAEMKALGFIPRAAPAARGAGAGRAAAGRRVRGGPGPRARPGRDARRQHLRRPPSQLAQGPRPRARVARGLRRGAGRSHPRRAARDGTTRGPLRRAGRCRGPGRPPPGRGRRHREPPGFGPRHAHGQRAEGRPLRAARRGRAGEPPARRRGARRSPAGAPARLRPGMLLKDATVATLDPPRVERASLRIEGAQRSSSAGRRSPPAAGEEVVDLGGALVLPGLVNAHTHLYSALARGMPGPAEPPRRFVEILERVWWRLDRALDEESVYVSGLVGAIEAARSGTTLLFDHHSSPSFIRGSLATLRRAVEEVGLRSVLCYETTDRNGLEGRDAGIAENRSFLESGPTELTPRHAGGPRQLHAVGREPRAPLGRDPGR